MLWKHATFKGGIQNKFIRLKRGTKFQKKEKKEKGFEEFEFNFVERKEKTNKLRIFEYYELNILAIIMCHAHAHAIIAWAWDHVDLAKSVT